MEYILVICVHEQYETTLDGCNGMIPDHDGVKMKAYDIGGWHCYKKYQHWRKLKSHVEASLPIQHLETLLAEMSVDVGLELVLRHVSAELIVAHRACPVQRRVGLHGLGGVLIVKTLKHVRLKVLHGHVAVVSVTHRTDSVRVERSPASPTTRGRPRHGHIITRPQPLTALLNHLRSMPRADRVQALLKRSVLGPGGARAWYNSTSSHEVWVDDPDSVVGEQHRGSVDVLLTVLTSRCRRSQDSAARHVGVAGGARKKREVCVCVWPDSLVRLETTSSRSQL